MSEPVKMGRRLPLGAVIPPGGAAAALSRLTRPAPAADTVGEWEERSAIREFDGGQDRETAEREAAAELDGDVVNFRAAARRLRNEEE